MIQNSEGPHSRQKNGDLGRHGNGLLRSALTAAYGSPPTLSNEIKDVEFVSVSPDFWDRAEFSFRVRFADGRTSTESSIVTKLGGRLIVTVPPQPDAPELEDVLRRRTAAIIQNWGAARVFRAWDR